MGDQRPYISSGGPIFKTVPTISQYSSPNYRRLSFKELDLAPKNESYLINILRLYKTHRKLNVKLFNKLVPKHITHCNI